MPKRFIKLLKNINKMNLLLLGSVLKFYFIFLIFPLKSDYLFLRKSFCYLLGSKFGILVYIPYSSVVAIPHLNF